MEVLVVTAFYLAVFAVIIVVHELGHYFAGWAAGIPRRHMRVCLWSFPQHVALRSANGWVSPKTLDQYIATMCEYLPATRSMFLYVAGGFALETVFTVFLGFSMTAAGFRKPAYVIVLLSTFGVLWWLILDSLMILRGRNSGDFSGLWALSKRGTLFFIVAILSVRGWLLWHIKHSAG
jgi:hypothetical protein